MVYKRVNVCDIVGWGVLQVRVGCWGRNVGQIECVDSQTHTHKNTHFVSEQGRGDVLKVSVYKYHVGLNVADKTEQYLPSMAATRFVLSLPLPTVDRYLIFSTVIILQRSWVWPCWFLELHHYWLLWWFFAIDPNQFRTYLFLSCCCFLLSSHSAVWCLHCFQQFDGDEARRHFNIKKIDADVVFFWTTFLHLFWNDQFWAQKFSTAHHCTSAVFHSELVGLLLSEHADQVVIIRKTGHFSCDNSLKTNTACWRMLTYVE